VELLGQPSPPTASGIGPGLRRGYLERDVKKPHTAVHNPGMEAFVYILASKRNGSLYIGMTTDIRRRLEEHRAGMVRHTREYRIRRLVYLEPNSTIEDAALRERRLKEWRRAWKIRLIETTNPDWDDLARTLAQFD
jgi:putative endonuclease